ncbi:MAG: iron complex outermembrane receptor protein [Saprospiraceae bacterium]|jgi:iron complex outermembrane receptor protein
MKRFAIFTLVFFIFTFNLNAQFVIKGKVTDKENNEPLIGVSILHVGTVNGTISDIDGLFALEMEELACIIQFSYTGYSTQGIEILSDTTFINVKMEYDADGLISCDFGIIVRASPINVTLPVPFLKILPEYLKRDIDLSITPALNRVPGVHMHSGALNTNRITMRGIGNRSPFSTTKIRAYLDDIPLTTGDGETTIEDIDLSLIDEIKVWKGPTASIYGAGLGGMIHLQTVNQRNVGRSWASTQFTAGSYGLLRNSTTANISTNQKYNLRFNYNNTHQDGYRDNNEYDRQGYSFLGKFTPNRKNTTTLLANYTDVKAFIPSSLSREGYGNNPRNAAFTWGSVKGFEDYGKLLLGLSHRSTIAENIGAKIIQNKTSLFTSSRNNYESRPFNILEEDSQTFGARTSFEIVENGREEEAFPLFSLGAEFFNENYDWQTFQTNGGQQGELISDNAEKRIYYNVFTQYYSELFDKFYLLVGVNLNQTKYDYQDKFLLNGDATGGYSFSPVLSPRLGLSYYKNKMSIFATVSHGFSPPSVSETLTPDGQVNPDIQPEKGWNFEVGSRGKLRNGKFQYELSLYNMLIQDLLVAERIAEDQFVGRNAGKTRHAGIETYVSHEFIRGNNHTLTAWTTYTYSDYKFIDFIDEENDYSGNNLTGTPPHNLNIGVDYDLKNMFYGNLNFNYLSAFPIRDDNSISSEAYSLLNAKIGFKKNLGNHWYFDVSAGVRNILDEKYASMILINAGSFGGNAPRYYYPGLPRNFFGGIKLEYRF